ncbi:pyrroline-5-carboxylate reductase dimerization domain-containing protein [Brevibacillus parabrevis]|uniref:pyrroline-5-carboxylate reductase family protein n=1 Tax=Brevibacillus parabrevis TaxID=54914 RepID=UPI0028D19EB1|nr:pyrroline-5-carboxylate reductase dimerization domain-containing protein [Brevibacillus parabrevis]
MRIGIIGLGSMGQMLVKSFCKSAVISPEHIVVFNRTRAKADALQARFGVAVADSAQAICEQASLIFICTKPLDILPVLEKLTIPREKHIVSVAAGVSISDLESVHAGPVSKVIPTVTSSELHGVSLYTASDRVSSEERSRLLTLLSAIGEVQEVTETNIETATILSSSAPGLIAGMLDSFAQAAVRKTPELDIATARTILVETMLGTALLLKNEQLGFDQLIERVATKGGITEEGLRVLAKTLPGGFDELFAMTESKHAALKELVQKQVGKQMDEKE